MFMISDTLSISIQGQYARTRKTIIEVDLCLLKFASLWLPGSDAIYFGGITLDFKVRAGCSVDLDFSLETL
jgi:hypothetical protein